MSWSVSRPEIWSGGFARVQIRVGMECGEKISSFPVCTSHRKRFWMFFLFKRRVLMYSMWYFTVRNRKDRWGRKKRRVTQPTNFLVASAQTRVLESNCRFGPNPLTHVTSHCSWWTEQVNINSIQRSNFCWTWKMHGFITAISAYAVRFDSVFCDRCISVWSVRPSVRLSVCLFVCHTRASVTLVHPAKAAGRNEMPFGRDTRVAPSNIVLDGDPGPAREGDIWGSEPPIATLRQPPQTSLLVFARCQHLCCVDAACR